jgi:ribonuclease VapC
LNSYVLDAFAVLAFVNGEPGGPKVGALLEAAAAGEIELGISLINLGEVLYRIARQHGEAEANVVLNALDESPLSYLAVTRDRVLAASHLKATRPISYADAFAAAVAAELDAVVVTGDPEFRSLADKVKIEWLPQREP